MEYKNEKYTAESGFMSFDPVVILIDVAKRWLIILLAAIIAGVGGYIYTDAGYKPEYQSGATLVVTTRSSTSTVYSNLSSTTSLAGVFTELLNSSVLRKTIVKEIGADSFDGTITATAVPETNLVTVTVTASDPRTAYLVADAIIEHHESITYQVLGNITLEVLKSPVVPTGPRNHADSEGNMKKFALIAAVGAVAVLAWASFSKNTVRSGTEARQKLDCDYLGEIPHERKYKTLRSCLKRRKTSILVSSPITSFRFVETINKLRRRVEQHMHDDKVLMVTSLLENEGKSTVAVNLAIALAQKHERVLLIDCDLRKPACHQILERKDVEHGLHEVLTGECNLSDAIIRDKARNIYMILENKGDQNPGHLAASGKMQALLKWARTEFDYIVLDLPPMSVASDAEGVADLSDASLLVVRQNVAAAPAVNKAAAALDRGNAKLLGCVLNNVRSTFMSSGQGYGYGYGGYSRYGHYGKYGRYGYGSSKSKE